MTRNALLASIALVLGCVQPYIDMNVGGESSTSTSSPAPSTGEAIDDPERSPRVEEGDGDGGHDPGAAFIVDPDGGGPAYTCDVWAQDCPGDEKCSYWSNDGGGAPNATKCVPLDPDPDDVGEACTIVGDGLSGIDSCGVAAICWNFDSETSLGTCIAFCGGSEANPACSDPATHCVGRDFLFCLPTCCPLEQNCSAGQACYPIGHTFECVPDVSGEEGEYRDPCEFINVCDAGLFCANPESVPDCDGSTGCCTPFCDITAPDCQGLHPAMECIPWYEEGQAPPGEEHIGGCMVPS